MNKLIKRVLNKLQMDISEFDNVMKKPALQHTDYPTSYYLRIKPLLSKVKKILHLSKFFFTFVSYIKKNYKNDLLIKFIVVIFCKIIYINNLRLIN